MERRSGWRTTSMSRAWFQPLHVKCGRLEERIVPTGISTQVVQGKHRLYQSSPSPVRTALEGWEKVNESPSHVKRVREKEPHEEAEEEEEGGFLFFVAAGWAQRVCGFDSKGVKRIKG